MFKLSVKIGGLISSLFLMGCLGRPSTASLYTVEARNGLSGIQFVASEATGRIMYDDPVVAVQIKEVICDGKRIHEMPADSYPFVTSTVSKENSSNRVYMFGSRLEGSVVVITFLVQPSSADDLGWREVRLPAGFGYTEFVFNILYPDNSVSKENRVKIITPTLWHF